MLTLSKKYCHVAFCLGLFLERWTHVPLSDHGILDGKCGSAQPQASLCQDPLSQHQVLSGYLFYIQTILLVMNLVFNKWILIKVCVDQGLQYYFQCFFPPSYLHKISGVSAHINNSQKGLFNEMSIKVC